MYVRLIFDMFLNRCIFIFRNNFVKYAIDMLILQKQVNGLDMQKSKSNFAWLSYLGSIWEIFGKNSAIITYIPIFIYG